MGAYHRVLSLTLSAASVTSVSASQSTVGAANLLINGSAASGGVATFAYARQILFTFAADETGHNFTITGTAYNGQSQSEVVSGNASTAVTTLNYLTVTQIAVSAATTGALTVGTNQIGSSAIMVVDRFINPAIISVATAVSGTVNYSIQVAYDDFSPAWDLVANPPTWYAPTALATQTGNVASTIQGPISLIRILQNSGTGTTAATINIPMGFVG